MIVFVKDDPVVQILVMRKFLNRKLKSLLIVTEEMCQLLLLFFYYFI